MINFIFLLVKILVANVVLHIDTWRICRKLRIKRPKLILGRSANENKLGEAFNGIVFINISVKSLPWWKETVRHEMRHIWQDVHHADIVAWCISKPEYREYKEFYRYCPIELDARYYAEKGGDIKNSPIDFVSVETLEKMYQDGTLLFVG